MAHVTKREICLSFQALKTSETVNMSEDFSKVQAKSEPEKWPLLGPPIITSNLHADVPEFVPGRPFTAAIDISQSQGYGLTKADSK